MSGPVSRCMGPLSLGLSFVRVLPRTKKPTANWGDPRDYASERPIWKRHAGIRLKRRFGAAAFSCLLLQEAVLTSVAGKLGTGTGQPESCCPQSIDQVPGGRFR